MGAGGPRHSRPAARRLRQQHLTQYLSEHRERHQVRLSHVHQVQLDGRQLRDELVRHVALEKIKTAIGPVLADAKGLTLYWYAKDTKMASACTGSCATAWPPVTGQPGAAMGVHLVGKFGTIKRANGALQATYKGHPLYTYAGDSAPGQTKGNGLGGVWHVLHVNPKGAVAPGGMMSSAHPVGVQVEQRLRWRRLRGRRLLIDRAAPGPAAREAGPRGARPG